ncbi:MAG: VOC family protein [bacterium]|nr:VOC family protein [Candidatus Kapabacteria bacterium]
MKFYETELGFTRGHEEDEFGIVARDDVEVHFWKCSDRKIAEQTSCRIRVEGIQDLYAGWEGRSFIHPNARLETKWWGDTEFGVVDIFGNLIMFYERG